MITEQEAREADHNTHASDLMECGRFPKTLLLWAHQELARREAERDERANPITAELCKASGAVVTSPTFAFFRIPDAHNLNVYLDPDDSYVAYSDKSIPGVTTMGQLLDLLAALKGGAT